MCEKENILALAEWILEVIKEDSEIHETFVEILNQNLKEMWRDVSTLNLTWRQQKEGWHEGMRELGEQHMERWSEKEVSLRGGEVKPPADLLNRLDNPAWGNDPAREKPTKDIETRTEINVEGKRIIKEINRHIKVIKVNPSIVEFRHRDWYTKCGYPVGKYLETEFREKWKELEHDPILGFMYRPDTTMEEMLLRQNNYRVKMLNNLAKMARDGKKKEFDQLCWILGKRSNSFRQLMITETLEKIWTMPENRKRRICFQLEKILKHLIPSFNYRRVNIPKADGGVRPLSVPLEESRILGKWLLWQLEIWIWGAEQKGPVFDEHQHGSIKNRGCLEAWDYFFEEVMQEKFIMEFDIGKCFDNISWKAVEEVITELNVPKNLRAMILETMMIAPDHLPAGEWDEEESKRIKAAGWARWTAEAPYKSKWERARDWVLEPMKQWAKQSQAKEFAKRRACSSANLIRECWERIGKPMPAEIRDTIEWRISEGLPITMTEYLPHRMKEKERQNYAFIVSEKIAGLEEMSIRTEKDQDYRKFIKASGESYQVVKGLPQGWALSPILTNLVLRGIIAKTAKGVMYLDDGLIAGDSLRSVNVAHTINKLAEKGLTFSGKKVKWIKMNGEWLSGIKFLGMYWDQEKGWRANTRNGSQVRVPDGVGDRDWGSMGRAGEEHLARRAQRLNVRRVQLSYAYNKGGQYNGKQWYPISPDFLWYQAWKDDRRINGIQKERMMARAQWGQLCLVGRKEGRIIDQLEILSFQARGRLWEELSVKREDGTRVLKKGIRMEAYEKEFWERFNEEYIKSENNMTMNEELEVETAHWEEVRSKIRALQEQRTKRILGN